MRENSDVTVPGDEKIINLSHFKESKSVFQGTEDVSQMRDKILSVFLNAAGHLEAILENLHIAAVQNACRNDLVSLVGNLENADLFEDLKSFILQHQKYNFSISSDEFSELTKQVRDNIDMTETPLFCIEKEIQDVVSFMKTACTEIVHSAPTSEIFGVLENCRERVYGETEKIKKQKTSEYQNMPRSQMKEV